MSANIPEREPYPAGTVRLILLLTQSLERLLENFTVVQRLTPAYRLTRTT